MALKNAGFKYYYDACALESSSEIYKEIVNGRANDHIVSHLSLGEAYGSCLYKGTEQSEGFIGLITSIKSYIKIVGNDVPEDLLTDIKNDISSLSATDTIHVATAIREGCSVLKTTDNDLLGGGIPKKCNDLGKKYSISNFTVAEAFSRTTSSYAKKLKSKK